MLDHLKILNSAGQSAENILTVREVLPLLNVSESDFLRYIPKG
jgi:hypothetical protein